MGADATTGTIDYERGMQHLMAAALAAVQRLHPTRASDAWFLDIGAHVGVHALQFAARGTPVIALEPFPDTARRLLCSKAHGGAALATLAVLPFAAWATTGARVRMDTYPANSAVAFTTTDEATNNPDATIPFLAALGKASGTAGRPSRRFVVPTLALDDLFAANPGLPPPAVVKIDVEGGEGGALAGWARTLGGWAPHERPPVLVIELNAVLARLQGYDVLVDVAVPLVVHFGYRMWRGDMGGGATVAGRDSAAAPGYAELTARMYATAAAVSAAASVRRADADNATDSADEHRTPADGLRGTGAAPMTLREFHDDGAPCSHNFVFIAAAVADAVLAELPRDVFHGDASRNACA